MVQVNDATTAGGKELKRNWPITEGLIAGTTKQEGTEMKLKPEEEDLNMDNWGSL